MVATHQLVIDAFHLALGHTHKAEGESEQSKLT